MILRLQNSYDIANAFNTYFTTIGDSLANELPHSDIKPLSLTFILSTAHFPLLK